MKPLTIAVTGLNATDNPAPGVGVLRSLRLGEGAADRLVGLAYDALDPGVYTENLVDDVFLIRIPRRRSRRSSSGSSTCTGARAWT